MGTPGPCCAPTGRAGSSGISQPRNSGLPADQLDHGRLLVGLMTLGGGLPVQLAGQQVPGVVFHRLGHGRAIGASRPSPWRPPGCGPRPSPWQPTWLPAGRRTWLHRPSGTRPSAGRCRARPRCGWQRRCHCRTAGQAPGTGRGHRTSRRPGWAAVMPASRMVRMIRPRSGM